MSTLSMAIEVDSRKKLNKSWPISKNTAKFSMPAPRVLKMLENTAHMTRHIISGFKTLHATPSTLRRYFSLKSRLIRFCKR